MINRGAKAGESTSRLLVEKVTKKPTEEEQDAEDKRASKLFELLQEHGGKGRAKVYRVGEGGEPQYACTWPVDAELAESVEEKLAELGGGRYDVKLFWGSKCESSIRFHIDAETHPKKKTDAELRREGGALPSTPAELQAFMQNTIAATLAPIVASLQQPRDTGTAELVKLMMMTQAQTSAELREQNAALMQNLLNRGAAAPTGPRETLTELAATVSLLDTIRGDGGGRGSDPNYERRSLATKLIEGPLGKAAERMADRVVDKYLDDKPAPAKPGAPRAAQPQPIRAAAVPASQTVPPAQAPAPRPPVIPPATPTTPVALPQGVKPLSIGDLSRMKTGRMPRAATPAPVAAEAVPNAVAKG